MKIFGTVLALVVAIIGTAVAAIDYCDKAFCDGWPIPHIACNHPGIFNTTTCPKDASLVRIDNKLKKVILSEINRRHNSIAGDVNACHMGTVKWDPLMAKHASLNNMKCDMENYCTETKDYRDYSQIKFTMKIDAKDDYIKYIKKGFEEWSLLDPNEKVTNNEEEKEIEIERLDREYRRHVAIWFQDNYGVGCSVATYTKAKGERVFLLTCHYGTIAVDNIDENFRCAAPGMKCQTSKSKKYPNLCSDDEIYKFVE